MPCGLNPKAEVYWGGEAGDFFSAGAALLLDSIFFLRPVQQYTIVSDRSPLVICSFVTPEAYFFVNMEPPSKRARKLLDDDSSSDSGDESGGVPIGKQSPDDSAFKVNEDYARRFEHNKKREEMQKCTSIFIP